jgi:hypothetical protein
MTGLDPSGTGGLAVKVKTAVSTRAAVVCADAFEGRLRRPGKGTLFDVKVRKLGDDLINGPGWVGKGISMVIVHWSDKGEINRPATE